ncbi:hypothetical protein KSX_75850 [Ktedonospora formicarum]|uniref:Uncharacterized protein n=2 Tax=Ktedonospora formicarum TaxID=2778364 RepID=A0A8J3MUJ7_9CHLR|nr:hypothetical protein KSX_75850 [Ktedonospora formicarum]
MRQQKARTQLVRQFKAPSLALITLVRERAIQLYQEENSVSYSEAMHTILDLEGYNSSHSIDQSLTTQPGADPIVTILLLKAGYEEDALTYFCSSTGSSPEEAHEAIAYLQEDIAEGRDLWLFHQARTPEPAIIRFLLQRGHSLIAIRYYRDCTDVNLSIAQNAIKEYEIASS